MRTGILMVERMVLESLTLKPKNIQELSTDTGLKIQLLANIMASLTYEGMVDFSAGRYELNRSQTQEFLKRYQNSKDQLQELKELFVSFINASSHGKSKVKLQKVYLDAKEEAILNSYFINIETFIKNVNDSKKQRPLATGQQKVFIWGEGRYQDLAQETLAAI